MSYQFYKEKLGDIYTQENQAEYSNTPVAESPGNLGRNQEAHIRTRMELIDITEIQTPTLLGTDEETVLTSRYCPPPRKKSDKTIRKYREYAVLLRRIVKRNGDQHIFIGTELCIQSKTLCDIFREIVVDTYDSVDIKSTPIKTPGPFFELFFKRHEIKKFIEDTSKPKGLRAEVKLLHDFMQKDHTTVSNIKEYETSISQGKVSIDTLWTLFPPNELLIRNDGHALECYLCRDVSFDAKNYRWLITGVRLDFDGREIGLTKLEYPISFIGRIGGIIEIPQLPLLPFRYFPDRVETRERLVKRGAAFQNLLGNNLTGYAHCQYRGPFWKDQGLLTLPESEINERVIVDYKAYLDRHSNEAARLELQKQRKSNKPIPRGMPKGSEDESSSDSDSETSFTDNLEGDPISRSKFPEDSKHTRTDHFETLYEQISEKYSFKNGIEDLLLLCPAKIPGYGLKEKKWGWVLVDELKAVEYDEKAFDSLQIATNRKQLIKQLVEGHQNRLYGFDDLVRGKGKGLIFLLYGKPGIGKTLTAESIAENVKSPLYSVSGGELSVDVSNVETKLKDIFSLTRRWNAIVLLDEADVVMSKRDSRGLERNAIVAVWLRMIEYFEGILFLTTNRLDDFDEAVRSRIHLSINLPVLGPVERAAVWKSLVELNRHGEQDGAWNENIFKVLGELDLNGRNIKNILGTASYFAKAKLSPLQPCHVSEVIKVELSEHKNIVPVSQELERVMQKKKG